MQQAVAQRSPISNDLVTQFDPMINKMIKMVCMYRTSDVCLDQDDLFQEGRRHVLEAILAYDSGRGAKLSTFVYLKLWTKFANMGRNFKTRNKRRTVRMCDMAMADMIAYGSSPDTEISASASISEVRETESGMVDYLDAKRMLEALSPVERDVFMDHFVDGQSGAAIRKSRSQIGANEVKRTIRALGHMVDAR